MWERQSAPSGQRSQSRQTDGQRAAAAEAEAEGKAGRGERETVDRLKRPPPVGDRGDGQAAAAAQSDREALADSCP